MRLLEDRDTDVVTSGRTLGCDNPKEAEVGAAVAAEAARHEKGATLRVARGHRQRVHPAGHVVAVQGRSGVMAEEAVEAGHRPARRRGRRGQGAGRQRQKAYREEITGGLKARRQAGPGTRPRCKRG